MGTMVKKHANKKGGVIIFLTSILITMIMASMVFVHATRSIAGASYADAVLELAGRSSLSEFDRRLKDEYGIFAFYGYEDMVASNINFYASASFDKTLPGEPKWGFGLITDLFKLQLQRIDVSLASHSLFDVNVFEEQVSEHMNYIIAQKGIEYLRNRWRNNNQVDGTEGGDNSESDDGSENRRSDRELQNRAEIESLPSYGNQSRGLNLEALSQISEFSPPDFLNEGLLTVKINEYVLSHFNNASMQNIKEDTFFKYEVEYVLYGNFSDSRNLSRFRLDFVIFRAALNAVHIASSPEKRQAVADLSKAAGKFAPLAAVAIAGTWSLLEAENDARRLFEGQNVALFKTNDTWALSLANLIQVRTVVDEFGEEVGYRIRERPPRTTISPKSDKGMSYAEYLRLFLFFQNRETKLLRTMDLIQLNFRGSYYEEFLIKDHYTGFLLSATVSGKKFEYEQKY